MITPHRRPAFLSDTYRPDARIGSFLCCLVLSGISFGLYKGVQDNYLAEIINITPFERGIVEFFREMPGLLVVLLLALMYRFTESRVFKIGIALMTGGMAGILLTSASPFFMTKFFVVLFMVIFSTGEHIIMPVRTTISLDFARREKAGASLGLSSSIMQFGHIIGFILVSAVFLVADRMGWQRTDIAGFRIVFGISAALMIASVMAAAALRETTLKGQRRRFYFAKKFFKYYMLEVFYGARKQIFMTFAPYVLIIQYNADASVISLLFAITAGFGIVCGPLVGKIIDRLGYKVVMVGDTLILVVVCLLYGFAHRLFSPNVAFIVVCCNYVLDSIITLGSMASNVYVQRISSSQEEITATLSTGISVNHFISIFIALAGGWIWEAASIEVLFSLSAFLGLLNSAYAATISKKEENEPPELG